MTLNLHVKYMDEIIEKIESIDVYQREELLRGSVTNDLCNLTDELYEYILMELDTGKGFGEDFKELIKKIINRIGENSSFYQSHFGNFGALHAMANKQSEPAEITLDYILNWVNFLELIVLSKDDGLLQKNISNFDKELGDVVKDLNFKLSDIMDIDDFEQAKMIAIGMIIHIIQDSYTISHCKRNLKSYEIEMFHNYKSQKSSEHKKCDHVYEKNEEYKKYKKQMLEDIEEVLLLLLKQKSASHLYPKIFKISEKAIPSNSVGFTCEKP